MTFPELLSLLAFTTPFFCSLGTGWKADRGLGVLIGLIVGMVFGVVSFWGARKLFEQIANHPDATLFQAGVVFWILGFIFGGIWFTTFVIHHVAA
jgi:uncharacterized membrane protein